MHVYINIQLWYEASPSLTQPVLLYRRPRSPESRTARAFRADPPLYPPPHAPLCYIAGQLSLYKILFHFAPFMWETILLFLPPPTCIARAIAILLHVCCSIRRPPGPPCVCYTLYNIGNGNIV